MDAVLNAWPLLAIGLGALASLAWLGVLGWAALSVAWWLAG